MPLIIEGRVPSRWAEKAGSRAISIDRYMKRQGCVNLAFINNMPDAALEDTELQFFELLDIASGNVPVVVKLYSLTGVPRTDRGQRHLNQFYFELDELWKTRFDGIIVTGTEPRQPDLRQEPYWSTLADVLDWAERNTVSTILSCLAAHAGVLHSDGIQRHRLPDKQFGVFESARVCNHELTATLPPVVRFPHSRWNEVQEDALTSCGYTILTKSVQAGVDVFVKQRRNSLFLHFQGHPEYGAPTLMKEYRRDIRRYLKGERETYPSMPLGYFDAQAESLLTDFRGVVETGRNETLMEGFPEPALVGSLRKTWHSSAVGIYQNWLEYVITKKAAVSTFAGVSDSYSQSGKRSAVV
jgi:homoserine O-succinyltransferase